MENTITITVSTPVTLKDLSDLLCSAFEGGSGYWGRSVKFIEPKEWTLTTYPEKEGGKVTGYSHEYPFNEGGAVVIEDIEEGKGKKYTLDMKAIKKGAQIMAKEYPRHWGDFRKEDYDADTGDVFLQCCLFGKIIYGY